MSFAFPPFRSLLPMIIMATWRNLPASFENARTRHHIVLRGYLCHCSNSSGVLLRKRHMTVPADVIGEISTVYSTTIPPHLSKMDSRRCLLGPSLIAPFLDEPHGLAPLLCGSILCCVPAGRRLPVQCYVASRSDPT